MCLCRIDISSLGRTNSAIEYADYIARLGKKAPGNAAGLERDPCLHFESANMPMWARDSREAQTEADVRAARHYWIAADRFERSRGRLAVKILLSLPLSLTLQQQIDLARRFVDRATAVQDGCLPATWAIHAGHGRSPHLHLAISERIFDGHSRTERSWFTRASIPGKRAQDGGARKTRELTQNWIAVLRNDWAHLANAALEAAGSIDRMDPRSNVDRGLDSTPTVPEGNGPGAERRKKENLRRREIDREMAEVDAELRELRAQADAEEVDPLSNSRVASVDLLRADAPEDFQPEQIHSSLEEQRDQIGSLGGSNVNRLAADNSEAPESAIFHSEPAVHDPDWPEAFDAEPECVALEPDDFTSLDGIANDADDDFPEQEPDWASDH